MNDSKLQSFIDLIAFDQNLITLENSIQSTDVKIKQLHDDIAKLTKSLEQKKSEKKDLKKQLDLQELSVKDLQEKESHQSKVMQEAQSSKEHDAAQKELEYLNIERDKQEQHLMKLWNKYETLEKDLGSVQTEHDAKVREAQSMILQEQESMQGLQQELEGLSKQRDHKVAVVPTDWMNRYDSMRGRISDPVVAVSQESCSACFYSISSKDLQVLNQGELVQCKDCYRFLYMDQAAA